jgi:pantothenate kinase type III
MILLFDIGNTHTHLGLADGRRVRKQADIPTSAWSGGAAAALVKKFAGKVQRGAARDAVRAEVCGGDWSAGGRRSAAGTFTADDSRRGD